MPALVAGIHVFAPLLRSQDVDGRNKIGHDVEKNLADLSGNRSSRR
jgi:hypothetical protein